MYLFGNYGVTDTTVNVPAPCQVDVETQSPRPLGRAVHQLLQTALSEQALFDFSGGDSSNINIDARTKKTTTSTANTADTNLSWVPKQISATEYLVGVSNTKLEPQPLSIKCKVGNIVSIDDVTLDVSEKSDIGYLPHGFQGTTLFYCVLAVCVCSSVHAILTDYTILYCTLFARLTGV